MRFNHIGISSTDLDRSVKFYSDVFGATLVKEPATSRYDGSPARERTRDIFGPEWEGMRIAHLRTSDGVGLELFEFLGPKQEKPDNNFAYWRSGIFHFGLTTEDIEAAMEAIERNGGKVRSKLHTMPSGGRLVYAEDPDGTIFEIYTLDYAHMHDY